MTNNEDSPQLQKIVDKYGTLWTIPPSPKSNTRTLELWGDYKPPNHESFIFRQEGNGHVDVITLDLKQAYDLQRALAEAMMTYD